MVQILVLDNELLQSCNIESFVLDDLRLPLLVLIGYKREVDEGKQERANLLLPTAMNPPNESDSALDPDSFALLSHRELQTIWLLGQGKSVTHIAKELNLSVKTISTYRARALEKLKFTTTAQLIRYAIQLQLRHKDKLNE